MQVTPDIRGPSAELTRYVETSWGATDRLKSMGAVRYVGASFHSMSLAEKWRQHDFLDIIMVRFNIAHRIAQSRLFSELPTDPAARQGIMTFKSTAGMRGPLFEPLRRFPQMAAPTPGDLYRYSLSQSVVDVCLTGWRNRLEIDQALEAFEKGELSPEERERLEAFGDAYRCG